MEDHEEVTTESVKFLESHHYELLYVNHVSEIFANESYLSSDALLVREAIIDHRCPI